MNYYFIKKNDNDSSFYAQLPEGDLHQRIAKGEVHNDWLITINYLEESYDHFIREPRTPANWIPVKSFKENKGGNAFDTNFIPPKSYGVTNGGLFSYAGRINRGKYWVISAILGISNLLALLLAKIFMPTLFVVIPLLILVVLTLIALPTQVKRWHDRNKSGWMILINFIPIVGMLWALIGLGFLPGTKWANNYGSDPFQ